VQGLSKELLILSAVKHNKKCSVLKDVRRLYITFPRAERKLVIVGSMHNLKEVEPLDQFVAYIKKKNWYLDINNVMQLRKYFPKEAAKCLPNILGKEKP